MATEVSKIGYFKYIVYPISAGLDKDKVIAPAGHTNVPSAVSTSKVCNVKFEYEWSNNNCIIKNLCWYSGNIALDQTTGLRTVTAVSYSTLDTVFKQNGCLTITCGSQNLIPTETTDSNSTLKRNATPKLYTTGTDPISANDSQYLLFNFKYSYVIPESINDADNSSTSKVEYLVEIKNVKIPKISKYLNNVVFTRDGVNELIEHIKRYPVINIEEVASTQWATVSDGQPSIKVTHGNPNFNGSNNYKYVKVGSNVKFLKLTSTNLDNLTDSSYITKVTKSNNTWPTQPTGTFRVSVNNDIFEVPIMGLYGHLIPTTHDTYNIGKRFTQATTFDSEQTYYVYTNNNYQIADPQPTASNFANGTYYVPGPRWKNLYLTGNIGDTLIRMGNIYATTGNFTSLIVNGNTINATNLNTVVNGSSDTDKVFWRGDKTWSNTLKGPLTLSGTSSNLSVGGTATITGVTSISSDAGPNNTTAPTSSNAALICSGAGYFAKNLTASRVFNAVFNDYAECRTTISLTPGHVVIDQDDGSLACSSKRLQPGAQVISDTYGHLMGQTENATTPIAVAGRVLVYTYQPRENYHAGMAVCSAPDGTVDIMSRAEICEYPDCIVGIVSEIPQYETWGSDNVKVNGRIWIKVR